MELRDRYPALIVTFASRLADTIDVYSIKDIDNFMCLATVMSETSRFLRNEFSLVESGFIQGPFNITALSLPISFESLISVR